MSPGWLGSLTPDAAVEITTDRVSIAVISTRSGEISVPAYASEPLPADVVIPSLTASNIADAPRVAAALRRACDRLPSRPKRVALVVPDGIAKVTLLHFDSLPARRHDLDQLVRWQLRKTVPFPIDEACITYAAGAASGDAQRDFLAVAARREVVGEYEAVCTDAGLYAGLVDLSTLSLLNMFLSSPAVPTGDWLLVHVRADSTSIAIMRDSEVLFFRNRAEGDEGSLPDLVHQTAMYYQDRLSGGGFARVLVGGGGREDIADTVRRSVEERLGAAVEEIDPTRLVSLVDRPSPSRDIKSMLGPLVGMLMRAQREEVAV